MEPITRQEMFLAAASGEEVTLPEPITREEMYLKAIVENGGGGQGTSNYNALTNKPKINGVEVQGNKTSNDYGIVTPTKTSDLQNDSNFVADANYVHTDNNYDATSKGIVDGVTSALANKADNTQIQALTNEVRGNWATGGVNLFDINNVYALKNASVSNGVLTNTDADSRTYFNCYMWFLDSSRATISSSQIGQYNSNGTFTKDITIPSGTKYIQLGHSGSSKDIYIDANTNIAAGNYKLCFKLTGYNPSTIGGLVMSDIMICNATITDPTYQPYAKTNVELTQEINRRIENSASSLSFSVAAGEMYLAYTQGGGDNSYSYIWLVIANNNGSVKTIPVREGTQQSVSISVSNNVVTLNCSDTTIIMGYTKI